MSFVRYLKSSPLLALFLAIAAGYAIGQITIAGISFGAGAVLFSGLIIGAIAPKAAPPGLVGTIGLVMFVYGVGIQYGPQFFANIRGPGLKYVALSAAAASLPLSSSPCCLPSRLEFRSEPRPDFSRDPERAPRHCRRPSLLRATRIPRSVTRCPIPSEWSVRSC